MMRPPPDRAGPVRGGGGFHTLAAAVAHALRTPLAALSGEVELALHRERSAEAYRAALRRIADRVAELDQLTADLASFGSTGEGDDLVGAVSLHDVLAAAAPPAGAKVSVEAPPHDVRLEGNRPRLTRALALLVQHADRHRAADGRVRLRVHVPAGDAAGIELVIDASPPRFPGQTWRHLDPTAREREVASTSGRFQLCTAAHLVEQCGGDIGVECRDGSDAVRIRLRRADVENA